MIPYIDPRAKTLNSKSRQRNVICDSHMLGVGRTRITVEVVKLKVVLALKVPMPFRHDPGIPFHQAFRSGLHWKVFREGEYDAPRTHNAIMPVAHLRNLSRGDIPR